MHDFQTGFAECGWSLGNGVAWSKFCFRFDHLTAGQTWQYSVCLQVSPIPHLLLFFSALVTLFVPLQAAPLRRMTFL